MSSSVKLVSVACSSARTRPSAPALRRSATTSSHASPKRSARAGSARSKACESASPARTTSSARWTPPGFAGRARSIWACPPVRRPPNLAQTKAPLGRRCDSRRRTPSAPSGPRRRADWASAAVGLLIAHRTWLTSRTSSIGSPSPPPTSTPGRPRPAPSGPRRSPPGPRPSGLLQQRDPDPAHRRRPRLRYPGRPTRRHDQPGLGQHRSGRMGADLVLRTLTRTTAPTTLPPRTCPKPVTAVLPRCRSWTRKHLVSMGTNTWSADTAPARATLLAGG